MPELPEVETVVRTLRPRIVGSAITAVRLERPDIVTPLGTDLAACLTGCTVSTVERRGKRIVITLHSGSQFYIHLGMSGRLTVEAPHSPLKKHTHLILGFQAGTNPFEVRFVDPRRFGGIWWLGPDTNSNDRMGPEPLSLRGKQLGRQLARTRRAIKTALLDQALIAGLGNIYVDESLFAAGIHPCIPANQLTPMQIDALNRAIKRILKKAIDHRGSTLRDYRDANGASGGFQLRHKVYDRAEKPCRICKTSIERIVLGGRSTHFCPQCQPTVR